MTHAKPTVLTTPGYHAILTPKQADALSYIAGDNVPQHHTDIAQCFAWMQEEDIADGMRPKYQSTTPESFYSTLLGLERRGLVKRVWYLNRTCWDLTPEGEEAERKFC